MKLLKIEKIQKQKCYDLSIKNHHCFFANGILVHNSNAGVRVTEKKLQPQSRSRIIDIGNDNMGFALFCSNKSDPFRKIVNTIDISNKDNITLFGEWIGQGIQKGVAVSQLQKQFVIFKAYTEDDGYISIKNVTKNISLEFLTELNSHNVYFINQIPTYSIDIDFANPEDSINELDKLTLAVEDECPWGKFQGVSGIGEGLVFSPTDPELSKISDLWFKSKGLKHKSPNEKTHKRTEIDVTKVKSLKEFANEVLPEWRLEQGISEMIHNNMQVSMHNMGTYLQWICKDVLKECSDVISENQIDWKQAGKYVIDVAKQYYLNYINSN